MRKTCIFAIRNEELIRTMDWETFEKHKPFAGEKKASMHRRRVGHDYQSRRAYLITMVVEGRRPLLGRLVGDADAPENSDNAPRVELTELGKQVKSCWAAIEQHYPEVAVWATMVMPDHFHGILFVERQMEQHLGTVIKGFKVGCNKAYRQLFSLQQHCCSIADIKGNQSIADKKGSQGEETGGYLWERGYNDHILEGEGELDRWFAYLRNNPRRLAVKRVHPDFFKVRFGITIGSQTYAAIGNRFLLQHPQKKQVACTRSLTEEGIRKEVEQYLLHARRGAVLVSPAISDGERAVMRAALDAQLPLIFLTPWGFNEFSKPGHEYYKTCAEGRFLILAPWPHENRRIPLTRQICIQLNAMAKEICEGR